MLLENLSPETFVKKEPRKLVANNNRTEMLQSLPLETFVKKMRSKMLPEKTKKEC